WKGLFGFLTEGKTRLHAWSASLAVLPSLCPDFEDALSELSATTKNDNSIEMAQCIVALLKRLPLAENEQFDFIAKFLDSASLHLQVQVLNQLRGVVTESFIKLLANNLLIQNHSHTKDSPVETYQNLEIGRAH